MGAVRMSAIKVDFTIPREVDERLRLQVEAGQRSAFVAAAIRERLEALERERMEQLLEKGYKEMASEHLKMAREAFETQALVALRGRR